MLVSLCLALLFTAGGCRDDQDITTKTVNVGEGVTLTCSRSKIDSGTLYWIRLAAGNLPEVLGATYTFESFYVNKTPRITTKQEPGTFVLRIAKTELSDTAFYYCEKHIELHTTFLNVTFLRVQGQEPDITTVIQVPLFDPVHPGDSIILQCSVLSDPEKKTCLGDHSVYWFRAGSDDSHPSVIYTHGYRSDECEKSPEAHSLQKCVYKLSKNISSSDVGTYYCAVATCGEILFGDGTKVEIEENMWSCGSSQRSNTVLLLLSAALALSFIAITILLYIVKKNKYSFFAGSSADMDRNAVTVMADQQGHMTDGDSLVYSVANFTRKAGQNLRSGAKTVEGESIYSDVRVVG